MGLLGIWYNNFWAGAQTHAILPYEEYLTYFSPTTSSRGIWKATASEAPDRPGWSTTRPDRSFGGQPGTNGQHAFYQLIHQGTKLIPCDFIAAAQSHNEIGEHHTVLIANFLAQTEALMTGRTPEETRAELVAQGVPDESLDLLVAAKTFEGKQADELDPVQEADALHLGETDRLV